MEGNFLPPLNKRDLRRINKELEITMKKIDDEHSLSDEDRGLLTAAMYNSLCVGSRHAKKKFTPKKYRYWEKEGSHAATRRP